MTSIVGQRHAPGVWVLVGAAVLGGLSVGGLSLGPSPVRAAEAEVPPACERNDLPTPDAAYGESERTLLDPAFRLPDDYVPPDLVSSTRAGLNGGFLLRSVVIADLRDAVTAARKAGVRLALVSGYRAATTQGALLAAYTRQIGATAAARRVALPGHSEHQLGTAIDIAATRGAYAWMAANAWRFGWVMSYPRGKTSVTCYQFEPWHFRWVGRESAASVHASAQTLREWLWQVGQATAAEVVHSMRVPWGAVIAS